LIEAVLWDFGGVITSSPFESFNRYEQEHGLPADFIRSVNARNPDNNAWAQLESSEVDIATFDTLFAQESEAAGHRVPGVDVLGLLSGHIRPRMVAALRLIKQHYRIACITNNVKDVGGGPGMMADQEKVSQVGEIMGLFDFVIESSVVGFRKPDPRIYALACEKLGVEASQAIFLDDLGINLKPARAMGMSTIKVVSEEQALKDLSSLLDMDLL
jgi:putative hydrolase of the HAD superfamily